jgi:hypothetical protein
LEIGTSGYNILWTTETPAGDKIWLHLLQRHGPPIYALLSKSEAFYKLTTPQAATLAGAGTTSSDLRVGALLLLFLLWYFHEMIEQFVINLSMWLCRTCIGVFRELLQLQILTNTYVAINLVTS